MQKAFFVTGTDTEIGKTFVACALMHAWQAQGLQTIGYKPIAAGAEQVDGVWSNEDARRLQNASSKKLSLQEINPVCLRAPTAPHIAARGESKQLDIAPLIAGFEHIRQQAERVVVEGVGGFCVPLSTTEDTSHLAVALQLPIILVVGMRLGCLNHASLTCEAILARGLSIAGWVANTCEPEMDNFEANIMALNQKIPAPCLGILPRIAHSDPKHVFHYLKTPEMV